MEKEIRQAIEAKVEELNRLIAQANEFNLKVEFDTTNIQQYGRPYSQPLVSVSVVKFMGAAQHGMNPTGATQR